MMLRRGAVGAVVLAVLILIIVLIVKGCSGGTDVLKGKFIAASAVVSTPVQPFL